MVFKKKKDTRKVKKEAPTCHHCSKSFACKRNLLSHLKTQHGLARHKKRLSSCQRCFNLKLLFGSGNKVAPNSLCIPPFDRSGVCARCDDLEMCFSKV